MWPFKKKHTIPNPRDRKRRGDPVWMLRLVLLMKIVNFCTAYAIVIALALLYMVRNP
jgi:hypothetical protein